jgi:cytochrome c-type biogenesis protein
LNPNLLALAFGAGLLSFLSPCVLPLVPVYLGYLSGATVTPNGIVAARRETITHALAFVLGFTAIFVSIWSALFALTQLVDKLTLAHLSGVILVIFGFNLLGIVRIPLLQQEARLHVSATELGYPRSFLTGLAFAAGWTPCVGPMLSLILGAATQTSSALEGTTLLLTYSAGLGVPFLLTAAALEKMTRRLKALSRHLPAIQRISGALLITMGLLLLTDRFQVLNSFFFQMTPAGFFEFERMLARTLGIQFAR